MPTEIKPKQTFGGTDVAQIRPAPVEAVPPAINIVISFEEALKLHLSLGQALAKLNSHNRSITAGTRSAINLCLYPHKQRITVNDAQLPKTTAD
ncbi:MAG: hypothetical protein ACHRHE_16075 [Tepidisphaerales bacterium]